MPIELSQGFRFGAFTAEPLKGSVAGDDGQSRHLAPKAMDVLVRLAEAAPNPVTRDDLITAVWGERYVSDEVLTHAIKELRHALGDSPTEPQYIQTIPKRGYRLLKKPRPIDDPTPVSEGRERRYLIIAASLVLVVVAFGWFVVNLAWNAEPTEAAFEADEVTVSGINVSPSKRIAVLSFADLSPDGDQEYFSDGISEEILNQLAKIPGLRVISRHSAFSFKGQNVDIATIAARLDVSYVLEGSVRRSGDRVRITAQLIDAQDSIQLWSEAYDRDYSAQNLIEIQSEIARAITDQLRLTLTGDVKARLAKVPTENTEAYAAYLLGRDRLRGRKVAELVDAVEQFALAIELDPQFADAYAGLADACGHYALYSGGQSNELCPSSLAGRERLARMALELDPQSAEAWISLGSALRDMAERMHDDQPRPRIHVKLNEALAALERGLELNPTLSEGHHQYGFNLMMFHTYPDGPLGWMKAWQAGRWESAFERGLEVDPLSIPLHAHKSWYPITASTKEEAMWHGRRMVEIAPDSPRGYETVAKQEWELNGRIDESIPWMSKAMEIDTQNPEFPVFIGLAYAALGDPDMALAYFDLANAIIAPDSEQARKALLMDQATVRLVSGKIDAHQAAELLSPSSQPAGIGRTALDAMKVGVFVDLATWRPADALARVEVYSPECIGAKGFGVKRTNCPVHLIRVYQELGDHETEQAVGDAIVRRGQLLEDESPLPVVWWQLNYAGALAATGRTDDALDMLENFVAAGWRGDFFNKHLRFVLCCDVVFDAIRDHERFRAIAATIEADMAQQLENVREMERNGEIPTRKDVNALIALAREGG